VRGQVSHPCRIKGTSTVLDVLIFKILVRRE
jgi:hypothetical protein